MTLLALKAVCSLLLTQVAWSLTGQDGEAVGDRASFQAMRNLPSLRCGGLDVVGTGTRTSDLLVQSSQIDNFAATLTADQVVFLNQLRNSQYHSFAPFTADEMRTTFMFLYYAMDADGRNYFLNVRTNWDQIPYARILEAVSFWSPDVFLVLTKEAHCYATGRMNMTLLETYCSRFIEDAVPAEIFLATVNRCPDCVALGLDRRTDDTMIGRLSDVKCNAFMDKVRQYQPSGWDIFYLSWCPQAAMPADIDNIADTNFCDTSQQARLKNSQFSAKLKPKVLMKIGEKLVSCLGNLDTWTQQQITDFASYIVHMPRVQLRQMTISQLSGSLTALLGVQGIRESHFFKVLAFKITDWWSANSASSLDAATKQKIICIVVEYAPRGLNDLLTATELQTAIGNFGSQCSDFDIKPSEAIESVLEVVESAGFTWSADALSKLGSYIGALPAAAINVIPENIICSNWVHVKDADIPKPMLDIIYAKCKDTSPFDTAASSYTCNTLTDMGVLLRAVPKSIWDDIPDNILASCLSSIANVIEPLCKHRRGLCRAIVRKVKAYADSQSESIGIYLRDVGPYMSRGLDDYSGITLASLGGIDNLAGLELFDNVAAARALWTLIKQSEGEVTRDNVNYSGSKFQRIASIFLVAASDAEWDNLSEDESILQNLDWVVSRVKSGRVLRAIVKKLLKMFGAASASTGGICIDGPLVEQISFFLPHASPDNLLKFSKPTLRQMLRYVGQNPTAVQLLTRSKMRFLTKMAARLDNALTSISTRQLDAKGPMIWCGIEASDVTKLPDAALVKYGSEILSCPQLDFDTNQALVTKLYNLLASDGAGSLEQLADKAVFAVSSFLTSITAANKQKLAGLIRPMMEKLTEYTREIMARDDREVSAQEKAQLNTLRKTVMADLFDLAIEEKLRAASSGSSRRKRAAADADCTILSSFGGNLDFLSATTINGLQSSEVKSCYSQLSTTAWDSAQCSAWETHLKHSDGLGSDVTVWGKTDLMTLGTLVDCLTSAEVQTLDVDLEVMQALGTVNLVKSPDVVAAYISKNSVSMSQISADDLSDMGSMVCGFTGSHIGEMQDSAVHLTAKQLEDVDCLDSSQLTAIASKVEAVEGSDWNSKDTSLVEQFGQVAGGLSQTVLNTFTADHVIQMTPSAIAALPPASLASFDVAVLGQMSTEQVNAMTSSQLDGLSSEQKTTVSTLSTLYVSTSALDKLNNGAVTLVVSVSSLTCVLLPTLIVSSVF